MAVGDAYVFPGFLTPVLTLLFFQSHRLLFSHASAEVRGENTPERKDASTWNRTHNHQVMSPTCSPLSHPGEYFLDSLSNDKCVTVTWSTYRWIITWSPNVRYSFLNGRNYCGRRRKYLIPSISPSNSFPKLSSYTL